MAHDPVDNRAFKDLLPAADVGLAHDQMGNAVFPGLLHQGRRDVVGLDQLDMRAQPARLIKMPLDVGMVDVRALAGRMNVYREELPLQPLRELGRAQQQSARVGIDANRDHHPHRRDLFGLLKDLFWGLSFALHAAPIS